jgi:hypothetical protein
MKKRILAIIISLVITIHILPISTFALYTTPVLTSGNYTYTFNNNEVTITGVMDCISGNVVIPRNIDGFPVTKIGSRAFYECVGINSVIVPSSVTEIAYRAFYNAKNIETLTIAGVVTVRDQAFESVGISTIKFTSSTASVFAGRDIFLGANTLLKISVPNASLGAFKSNVLIDYSILDKFIGA